MNKFSILSVSFALAVGFAACDETKDDNPVLRTHEGQPMVEFLNTPTMQNMYIDFTEANASDNLHMTCSQPKEYGMATTVNYFVQVSLERAFTKYSEIGAGFTDCAQINPTNDGVSEAVCSIIQDKIRETTGDPDHELTTEDVKAYNSGDYYPVYMRLRSQVVGIPDNPVAGTDYVSNVVEYKHIRVNYMALTVPDKQSGIFLRGTMNDWGAPAEYEFYTTKVKGTYITNVVTLPAGTSFKAADANWGNVNLGGASAGVEVEPDGDPVSLKSDGKDLSLSGGEFQGVAILSQSGSSYKIRLVSTGAIKDVQNINGMLGSYMKELLDPWLE